MVENKGNNNVNTSVMIFIMCSKSNKLPARAEQRFYMRLPVRVVNHANIAAISSNRLDKTNVPEGPENPSHKIPPMTEPNPMES